MVSFNLITSLKTLSGFFLGRQGAVERFTARLWGDPPWGLMDTGWEEGPGRRLEQESQGY